MGALPKRKLSHARSGERRAHLALTAVGLVTCPNCHKPRLPHRVCPSCGFYKGKEVVEVKSKKAK